MSLDFTRMHYVLGIWFVPHDESLPIEDRSDWLGCLYQEHPLGPWVLTYRFRYRSGPEPWDTHDVKHWFRGECAATTSEADLLKKQRVLVRRISLQNRTVAYEILVRGDGRQAMTELLKQPWCHGRMESIEEEDEV